MQDCLKENLGLPLIASSGDRLTCGCHNAIVYDTNDPNLLAALSCHVTYCAGEAAEQVTARHDKIKELVADFIKRCLSPHDSCVTMEKRLPGRDGVEEPPIDIVIQHGAVIEVVDVVIGNPAANCYCQEASKTKDYVNNLRVNDKMVKHWNCKYPLHVFTLESTGKLSEQAWSLINKFSQWNLTRPPHLVEARRHFLRQLSVTLARANAIIIATARSKLRLVDDSLPNLNSPPPPGPRGDEG